jgi:hypothetical protein
MIRTSPKKPIPGLSRTGKPAGSSGAPPAVPVGVPLPVWARRRAPQSPSVRPPSLARFPGLLCPSSDFDRRGVSL